MAVKSNAGRYAIWLLAAVGIHAMLLFGPWGFLRQDATYSVSPEEGIEVSIVESSPEPAQAASAPAPAPVPEVAAVAVNEPPPVPPPVPTPPPDPIPKPDPVPDPEPPKPPDKPEKPDKPPEPEKPKPKPHPERPSKPAKPAEVPHSHPVAPAPAAQGSSTGVSASQSAGAAGGSANSKPGYLSNPHPAYPPESKLNHEQGIVMLSVSIDERGEVVGVSVSQSSGYPRLDSAARDGVKNWRFRPARVAGFPVASHLAVPIRFRLND